MGRGRSVGGCDVHQPQLIVCRWLEHAVMSVGYCLSSLCLLHQGHVAQKLSASTLHKRAERVAYAMQDKLKLTHGDHVALLYTPSEWRGDHTPWRSASHLPPLLHMQPSLEGSQTHTQMMSVLVFGVCSAVTS